MKVVITGAVGQPAASAEPCQATDQVVDADYDTLPRHAGREPLVLGPARTALFVIDMQRYFVRSIRPSSIRRFAPWVSTRWS